MSILRDAQNLIDNLVVQAGNLRFRVHGVVDPEIVSELAAIEHTVGVLKERVARGIDEEIQAEATAAWRTGRFTPANDDEETR